MERSIPTFVVNSHALTYRLFTPADNNAQLEFNCSENSDYYIDLNSVRLFLLMELLNTDRSDLESDEPNTNGCVNNLLHSICKAYRDGTMA